MTKDNDQQFKTCSCRSVIVIRQMASLFSKADLNKYWHDVQNKANFDFCQIWQSSIQYLQSHRPQWPRFFGLPCIVPLQRYYEITKNNLSFEQQAYVQGRIQGMAAGGLRLPSPFQPILIFYDGMFCRCTNFFRPEHQNLGIHQQKASASGGSPPDPLGHTLSHILLFQRRLTYVRWFIRS